MIGSNREISEIDDKINKIDKQKLSIANKFKSLEGDRNSRGQQVERLVFQNLHEILILTRKMKKNKFMMNSKTLKIELKIVKNKQQDYVKKSRCTKKN